MKVVYIAHSMTNGSKHVNKINALITWLKKKRYKVSQPNYALFPDVLAAGALTAIERSKIVIADVTVYSHGVGFEIGYAYALKKDIILIANISAKDKVSKFLFGLFQEVIFYHDEDELISEVSDKLGSFSHKKTKRKVKTLKINDVKGGLKSH